MKKLLLVIGVSLMFLLSSCDAIERSMFEDLIKENLYDSGYTDYSYYDSQSWSNHTTELREEKLYELGFIGNYKLLGYSTLGNHPVHKMYLTSDAKNLLFKKVFNDYNGGIERNYFHFITRKYRFLEVTDIEYITDNKVNVKYSMVLDIITDLDKKVYDGGSFEGEIFKGYGVTFVDKGYGWEPKGGDIWEEYDESYSLGKIKTNRVENRHLGINEDAWGRLDD